jgi:GDSL-like Lipase/Acylhydrolase family
VWALGEAVLRWQRWELASDAAALEGMSAGAALHEIGVDPRAADLARPIADGEYRVLCLGDSVTHGTGVEFEQTWPKQLERMLADVRLPPGFTTVRVINAGGEGSSLVRAAQFFAEEAPKRRPHIVVLGFSASMVASTLADRLARDGGATSTSAASPSSAARARQAMLAVHRLLARSLCYQAVDTNVRRRLYRAGVLQDRLDKPSGAIFAYGFDAPGVDLERVELGYHAMDEQLAHMATVASEQQIRLVCLGVPSRFVLSEHDADNERGYPREKIRIQPLDRFRAGCEAAGVPLVDARPRLRRERAAMLTGESPWDDLYTPFDFAHLNSRGHQIAAEEVRAQILLDLAP